MKIYFTADTHFYHDNIIKYCGRPFKDVTHMNEILIRNWNARVTPVDTIFHLGDFCFKHNNKILSRLNGNKIFIKGNHDKKGLISDIFIELLGQQWLLTHNPNEPHPRIIHGHVHNLWQVKKTKDFIMINVGVDVWDFRPVELQTIIDLVIKNDRRL